MTPKEKSRRKQDRLIRYLCDFMVRSYIKDNEGRFDLAEKAKGVRSKKVLRALKALYGRTKFGTWVREPLESNVITRRLEQMMKERDQKKEPETLTQLIKRLGDKFSPRLIPSGTHFHTHFIKESEHVRQVKCQAIRRHGFA